MRPDLSVESKPNSRMIKMKTIGVVLMASLIIDKKSPRPGYRAEHRATDSRGRTRRNVPARVLGDCICLHVIFLKRSNIDISRSAKFLSEHGTNSGEPGSSRLD